MKYHEQLKHPKWQRKRLEIMKRDGFKCRVCGSEEEQLQIHHLYYLPKTKPWEYDDEAMVTVCHEHHRQLTEDLSKLSGIIAFKILRKKYNII
jgi:5-methylcytosine-specific restriction endonuclease McrA